MKRSLSFFVMGGIVLVFFWACKVVAAEEKIYFASGAVRNILVELFTSDVSPTGNPALEWMTGLMAKESDGTLWKKVVPIAMHVHAWDIPGQKDTFGRPEYDERLLAYKKKWSAGRVYCPTVVTNGADWSGWSRQQPFQPETEVVGEHIADGTEKEGLFKVSFKPAKGGGADGFTIHGALVAFGLRSKPSEGKNRGKSLQHDFISLIYRANDLLLVRGGELTSSIELARPKGVRIQRYAAVFWVTKKGDVVPLQATGGYLPY